MPTPWVRPTNPDDAEKLFGLPMGQLEPGSMAVSAVTVLKVLAPNGEYSYNICMSGGLHLVEIAAMIRPFADACQGLCANAIAADMQRTLGGGESTE